MIRIVLTLAILVIASSSIFSQSDARAIWQVTNFDITVSTAADRTLNAKAVLAVRNIGRGAGPTLSLRMNPKIEIKSITVGSAVATHRSRAETGGKVQGVIITLPAQAGPNDSVNVTVDYRLPVTENSGLNSISPVGSQFLPQSMWFPVANNSFAIRGADYAPFRLTVSAPGGLSSGIEKSPGVFEQSLHAQPFFLIGNWDRVEGVNTAKGITAYLPKGVASDQQQQAEALIGLTNEARTFFSGLLGPIPDVPIRLIAVRRGAGFDDAGAILLGEGSFARKKVDATTAMTIAEATARLWIGGATTVRGEGNGVVREGLSRFLATLFLEKQFGPDAAESERARQRSAYAGIARRDGPLSRTTPTEPTYFSSVANKGAMVWRLADRVMGREAFMGTLKGLLGSEKQSADGLSLQVLRNALAARGGASFKTILDQQLDQTTDMDLMAGLPHQENGQWIAALRNLGSVVAVVTVVGYTSSGQRIMTEVSVAPHDFGQALFKNAPQITRVEVDPEKLYPQLDYTNDIAPRMTDGGAALAEASRLFGAQDYAKAENLARQLLSASRQLQEARIILGRTLLAQNKNDQAETEFKQLLNERLPLPAALAWGAIGLGEIALRRGQSADAVRYFTEAVRADAEYSSTFTARSQRIRAETNGSPVDDAVRSFITQLDAAIRSGRQAEIAAMITPGELSRFVQQLVGSQPEAWQTKVVRTEQLGADRVAAEVMINSRQLGVDHSGTAVFIVTRAGGSYKLDAIEFFEVK